MLSSAALAINARLLTIPQSSEKGALPRCSAPSLAGGLGASRQLFLLGQAVLSAGCNPATLLPAREGEKNGGAGRTRRALRLRLALVLLLQELLQVGRHEVRLLGRAIVSLQVFHCNEKPPRAAAGATDRGWHGRGTELKGREVAEES